ncbi:MAG: serine--tRNA ligase, partial [Vibrio sp.]|nr:serine--tRNA ligase [Vibrio sp.]
MLDSKLLRTELDETAAKLARRGFKLDVETIRQLEEQRKSIQVEVENLQSSRNSISKEIGQKMAAGDKAGAEAVKLQIGSLGSDLDAKKAQLNDIQAQLDAITMSVPNVPDESVPDGKDENDNVEVSRW